MVTILKNIKNLLQATENKGEWVSGKHMDRLPQIANAYLVLRDDVILDYGPMENYKPTEQGANVVDCSGCMVMPTFCDSHTHLVYAGSRELEYVDKIKGLSYEEIAQRGGGILNSAQRLNKATEEELFADAAARLTEIMQFGTGAVEIKSGYGLDVENELKMLRVIQRLKANFPITIKSTLLAAHALPIEYKGRQTEYVDYVINEMIPLVAAEELADYIDVFCDKGFFTVEDTDRILLAGLKHGLRPKIHANELALSGGVQVGVKYNALSVDHLEYITDAEITCLLNSETMPTVLPGAAFFLNLPLSPVRQMIEAGLPVAMASDYNPGSSPSGNMKFVMSLACIKYRMTPAEALNAVTLNTAYAMGLSETHGTITKGKSASIIITKPISTFEFLPYAYTTDLIQRVMVNGVWVR